MSSHSRRTFLSSNALAALGGATQTPYTGAAEQLMVDRGPDLAVLNAQVYTVDDKQPSAEAFTVTNGRFVVVGSNREVRRLLTTRTHVIDAGKKTVVPGFIDAHCHPAATGIAELLEVDCDRRTIAEIKDAIRARASTTTAGQWVFGFKYDDTKLKDRRPLTRADLDEAAPKHPVRIGHRGGHTAVVNSLAFNLAGIDRKTRDPQGGKFGRDDKGHLTGFVAETAYDLIKKVGRQPAATARQRHAGVKLMSERMTAAGLTTVHDVLASRDDFIAYQDALAAGELRFRVYILAQAEFFETLVAAGVRPGFGNEWLRIGGLKLFCDGSASERTMRMSKPYVGRPGDHGILVVTQEKLNEAVRRAHALGFQVGVHANGDVAIDMVLKAYDLALRAHRREAPRHRIEHCTLVNPGLLKRIAAQGVIPTPFYTYVYYHGDKWRHYGEERVQWMFAHRSFLDHGIKVAGASDYVPGPYEPLMAIQSMVTRKDYLGRVWGKKQKIKVEEALRVCTIHGAHASFEEKVKGSITEGKLADFVILGEDPHRVNPDRIKDIRVERTVVGGRTVHERKG
jgi:predicted amidohydrolase YtcJ